MRHFLNHVASNMARHNATDVLLVARNQLLKEFYLSSQNPRDNLFIRRSLSRFGVRLSQKVSLMLKSEA